MNFAPIVLFVYNRPEHTRRTLEALSKNIFAKESDLYIYADGLKEGCTETDKINLDECRKIIRNDWGFKSTNIIYREKNVGLADNIIDGVTHIVNKYGKIIVLEDDIITSSGFLKYMNDALTLYENEDKVMHISGYMFPVDIKLPNTFFYNTASCWGWATWGRAWNKFECSVNKLITNIESTKRISEFNIGDSYDFFSQLKANSSGEIKTWAVRWYASMFIVNGFSLHPYPSLTNNIGHDGSGENCSSNRNFAWDKLAQTITISKIQIIKSEIALKAMIKFHNSLNKTALRNRIKYTISKLSKYVIKGL